MDKHIYHTKDLELMGMWHTAIDAEEDAYSYLSELVDRYELPIHIYKVYVHGSRVTGNSHKGSDLDFVVFYTGDMKEDSLFNIFNEDDFLIEDVFCDFNPIQLNLKENKDKQIKNYIKLHDQAIMEDACYALSDSGKMTDAFSYEIKPLNTTLSQAGNDPIMLNKNDAFKFFIGDIVKGYCPFDKKWHKGMIKYLYWNGENQKVPKYAYIQDFNTESTVAVNADNLKTCMSIPDFQFRVQLGPYDNMQYRAIVEKISNAVSTGIRKALILDDEDVSMNYKYKLIVNNFSNQDMMTYHVNELLKNSNIEYNYEQIMNYYKEGHRYEIKNFNELKDIFDKIKNIENASLIWISNLKKYISVVLKDQSEINFYKKARKKRIFLKFANDDILNTENEILISLDKNHNIPEYPYNWQSKEIQIQSDEYVVNYDKYSNPVKIAECDYSGYENCLRIQDIVKGDDKKYGKIPAIKYCLNLKDINGYQGYLPAMGQLKIMYDNIDLINHVLMYLNTNTICLNNSYWWSSTEYGYYSSWCLKWNRIDYSHVYEYWNVIPLFALKK